MILNTGLALVALLLAFAFWATEADAQNVRCVSGVNLQQCRPVVPGSPRAEEFDTRACDFRDREVDGVCTNQQNLTLGAAGTAHFSYFDTDTTTPTGTTRESARLISNVVSSQSDNMFNDRGLSELLVFFGQFLDHCTVQSPASREKMDIEIPRDDPLFGNFTGGELPFERTKRVAVSEENKNERPTNVLSSAVDLAAVYGANIARSLALRVGPNDCKLKTTDGNFLPLNTERLVNDPDITDAFFVAGDIRSNENPVLTAIHTVFLREHNRLCDELSTLVPPGGRRFMVVRQLNIAQFQRIVFEEFYPAITGRNLSPYTGHKPATNVGISLIFSTAAFRIGHTMIGNEVPMRGPGNVPMGSLTARESFFRTASFFKSIGPEPFIRGVAGQRAQEIDTQVMDSLRQVLFSNVPAFPGVDLIALNLQRGRDHALPSYNTVRAFFGLSTLSSFNQVTTNGALITRLQAVYDAPDDMDLWVALLAEDHEPRSSMGPTMLAIWEAEFTRLRDGDIFYYENGARRFFGEIIEFNGGLPTLQRESNLLRQIILRNTNIADADLPQPIFMV